MKNQVAAPPKASAPDPARLNEIARQVRLDIVEMLYRSGSGHLGGSLSATDILVALFFAEMRVRPNDPCWPDRDRFILSKGHGAPALYAVLSRLGYFPREELATLRQFGSILQGHPDSACTPGVEIPTGSLGQGLSIANGLALATRLNGSDRRIYVLMGDGEIQEGQIWEAAMTAAHYRLGQSHGHRGPQPPPDRRPHRRRHEPRAPAPTNGRPSAGTPWRWTATISRSSWRPSRPAAASRAGPA